MEEDKEYSEITTGFHIFLAIAFTCFMWVCIVKPFTTLIGNKWLKYIPIVTIMIIATVFTSIVIYEELYKNSLSEENNFALAKIIALIIPVIIREFFLFWHVSSGSRNFTYFTYFTIIILVVNILEASISSYLNIKKPELDNVTEVPNLGMVSFINGCALCAMLCMMIIRGYRVGMNYDKNSLYIVTKFGPLFIIAYTLWNLLFVIQLGGLPTLLNFFSTLLLPILVEYSGQGDWLHTRGVSLLFFILITMGIGPDESNLLPMYNISDEENRDIVIKTTYNTELMKVQEMKEVKITVAVMSCIFVIFAMCNECYKLRLSYL